MLSFELISSSIEQGLAYAIMALGVFITYRVLQVADLTVDGTFPLGAAVAASLITAGVSPFLACLAALFAGMLGGALTGVLHTKLKIAGLLAGILTMTGLYSVNLRIMGRANIPLLRQATVFTLLEELLPGVPYLALLLLLFLAVGIKLLLDGFLSTDIGLAMRATGDSPEMIRSLGVDTQAMTIVGLSLANGLVALSGALVAQYQGFADVGMGIGTVVVGLASVIIGTGVIRSHSIFRATFGVLMGAIIYRLAIFFALRMGLEPTDLRIMTAVLVIAALALPTLRTSWQERSLSRQVAIENARLLTEGYVGQGGGTSSVRDSQSA
ncbi:MAG: ABC transporter permease [Limnochordia bacterium]|jgi:putative ABC transport system permease protein